MSSGWIILGIIVIAVLFAFGAYNRLVALSQRVGQAFADIDVQLKLRHDLIPNLVETVKGYATHERGTLEEVVKAKDDLWPEQRLVNEVAKRMGKSIEIVNIPFNGLFPAVESGRIRAEAHPTIWLLISHSYGFERALYPELDRLGGRLEFSYGKDGVVLRRYRFP